MVLATTEDAVGYISFNRPDSLNAFNLDLAEEFINAMAEFERDGSIRAVVIKGMGRVFSAGGDVKEMLGYVTEGVDRAAYFRAPLASFGRMVLAIRNIPKPVLAAMHGAVAGVAFNLMLATDIRIAEENTRFTQAFIKLGLSPDGGGTWWLPQLVGLARANELAMLPTELDARKALEWGLINYVVPADSFDSEVKALADRLAAAPANAIAKIKKLINQCYDNSLGDHMEIERLVQVENAAHFNFEEGLRAFVEKREPRFR